MQLKFFFEDRAKKEIKMCYIMKKKVQVAMGISGESNQKQKRNSLDRNQKPR